MQIQECFHSGSHYQLNNAGFMSSVIIFIVLSASWNSSGCENMLTVQEAELCAEESKEGLILR